MSDAGMYVFREWLALRRTPKDRAHRAWEVLKSFVFGIFSRFSRRVTQRLHYRGHSQPFTSWFAYNYNPHRVSEYMPFSSSYQTDWYEYFLDWRMETLNTSRIFWSKYHPLRIKNISEF
jgi:hypothetical protein